jgi:hypothetical protein
MTLSFIAAPRLALPPAATHLLASSTVVVRTAGVDLRQRRPSARPPAYWQAKPARVIHEDVDDAIGLAHG